MGSRLVGSRVGPMGGDLVPLGRNSAAGAALRRLTDRGNGESPRDLARHSQTQFRCRPSMALPRNGADHGSMTPERRSQGNDVLHTRLRSSRRKDVPSFLDANCTSHAPVHFGVVPSGRRRFRAADAS